MIAEKHRTDDQKLSQTSSTQTLCSQPVPDPKRAADANPLARLGAIDWGVDLRKNAGPGLHLNDRRLQ